MDPDPVEMGPGASGRGSAPGGHGSAVEQWASQRERYLDNLKVILIAVVIAGHALVGYSEFDWWSYSDVREVTLAPVTTIVLIAVALPFALLVIPLLFLVSGLLTPPSVERKGTGRFVRDRLLRLGVPFVVFAILLWPLLEYGLFRWLGEAPGFWVYLRAEGSLDTGVLWFVGALLVFSLAYAGWVRIRRGRAQRRRRGPIRLGHLAALAGVVTVATFLLRMVVPFETDNWFIDVNLWEWPASAALFGLGVVAAREGWVHAAPDRLRRQSRTVTLIAVAAAGAFALAIIALGVDEEQLWGGWHWTALAFAAGECTLSVFGPVWLLGSAQRLLDRPLRWAGPAISRSAYGAFLLQGIVLIGLALALRVVPFPAEVKAILVAVGGVAGSFALAWVLISRVPGVARVL
ncbi:acyltransferase [Agromyces tardus]|uniref:acyltransferase family protein n=1 Tax=Agromyces tardus TaxID=2583849 RepID=UPI00148516B8|nr:acyltransferase [Agromyces tardus]